MIITTDITTIGEVLIDLTQTGVNAQNVPMLAANPGGAPANVAVAAARLGAKTAFCGKVGRDGFGSYLSQVLQEKQTIQYSHTLESLIGGQTAAGFAITGFYEDVDDDLICRYSAKYFATRAVK